MNKKDATVEKRVTVTKKKKIRRDEEIEVMSFTTGEVIWINPRTGAPYIWSDYGVIKLVPFSELIEMNSRYPKYLKQPWLLLLDDRAIEHFGLTEFYKTLVKPEKLDEFYQMSDEDMVEFLHNTTKDMRALIVSQTREKIRNKEFGDLFKIRLIESTINEINTDGGKNPLLQISLLEE